VYSAEEGGQFRDSLFAKETQKPQVKRNARYVMKSMKKSLAPIHPTFAQAESD
jgi:hypothetical protein